MNTPSQAFLYALYDVCVTINTHLAEFPRRAGYVELRESVAKGMDYMANLSSLGYSENPADRAWFQNATHTFWDSNDIFPDEDRIESLCEGLSDISKPLLKQFFRIMQTSVPKPTLETIPPDDWEGPKLPEHLVLRMIELLAKTLDTICPPNRDEIARRTETRWGSNPAPLQRHLGQIRSHAETMIRLKDAIAARGGEGPFDAQTPGRPTPAELEERDWRQYRSAVEQLSTEFTTFMGSINAVAASMTSPSRDDELPKLLETAEGRIPILLRSAFEILLDRTHLSFQRQTLGLSPSNEA